MTLIQSIILGIVQGVTEFLPVSSSAHLVLVPHILGWNNLRTSTQMTFDVVLHLGSLLALLVYFRNDLISLVKERTPENNKLFVMLIIGTIPAVVAALLFGGFFKGLFDSARATAALLIITGMIIFTAEFTARLKRNFETLRHKDSLLIGLAQAVAIAPGISRSGSTISVGLMLGLSREAAARFSFLMAIPIVFGAFLYSAKDASANISPIFIVGFLSSFIFSYAAIKFLLGYLQKGSLKVFAGYCIVVGILTLIFI